MHWNQFTTEQQTTVGVLDLTDASGPFDIVLELQLTAFEGQTYWQWVLASGWHWPARVMASRNQSSPSTVVIT